MIKDVGMIKSIRAFIQGKYYPHSLYVNLKDQHDSKRNYFIGFLDFQGWKEIEYINPNYLNDIKFVDIDAIPLLPLYPRHEPHIRLDSIAFFKHADEIAEDFITYIAWIEVDYKTGISQDEGEVDDEAVWEIHKTEYEARAKRETNVKLETTN